MILYFYGDNSFAVNRQLTAIKDKYQQKVGSDGDFIEFDLEKEPVESFMMSLMSIPMFSSSRLVFAENVSKSKLDSDDIDKIIDSTPDSTNLVLIDLAVDKRKSVFKKLSKISGAKEFKSLSNYDLPKWVMSETKKMGAHIDLKTAQYLIDFVGKDQWLLHNEIQKLSASDSNISEALINDLSHQTIESSSFTLAEALAKKDLKNAIQTYDELKFQGNADQLILGAIIYQFRMIMLALVNDSELNKEYGAYGYPLQKATQIATKLSLGEVKNAYRSIAQADLSIKTGELGSEEAMRELIYDLCQ